MIEADKAVVRSLRKICIPEMYSDLHPLRPGRTFVLVMGNVRGRHGGCPAFVEHMYTGDVQQHAPFVPGQTVQFVLPRRPAGI